jgi:hypothetical protein
VSKSVIVGGRNFFCIFTDRAVRVRWLDTTLIDDRVPVASPGPTRSRCLMKRFDCPRRCKFLGGPTDPDSGAG